MIEIKKYTDSDKKIWDSFVEEARNKHFFFYRSYMEYHKDRFKDFSLMFLDERGKLLALLPATQHGTSITSHGGLTFGGFVIGRKMETAMMLNIMETLCQFLLAQGFSELIYKCMPHIYHTYPAEEDRYALFRNDAQLFRRDVSAAVWIPHRYKYHKGRNWMVKRGRKNNVEVRESTDFISFMKLENEILQKYHGARAVHTGEELSMLAKKFPEHIHLYVGELNGSVEAGAVVFENGDVVHTQYLANSDIGRATGALDCIIDTLISETYADHQYFDFGTSNQDEGRYLNEGLIAQKEGFGARAVVHDFYRLVL